MACPSRARMKSVPGGTGRRPARFPRARRDGRSALGTKDRCSNAASLGPGRPLDSMERGGSRFQFPPSRGVRRPTTDPVPA